MCPSIKCVIAVMIQSLLLKGFLVACKDRVIFPECLA